MAADAAAHSTALLDAPVSGGREGAVSRNLLLMAGGSAEHVRAAMPVFSCYASRIRHVGGTGAGQTAKILNNLLLNANLAASHFVLAYGESLGISRAELRETMLAGTASSTALDWLDRVIIPGSHPATLGRKDLALARDLTEELPDEILLIIATALAGRQAIAGVEENI
jgi:3-hydroxyisobutyrate dehydrogenase-like beta-hydroxyacid dehydrogenase